MVISKSKNVVVTFDNEVSLTNQEKSDSKKGIIFDFVDKDAHIKHPDNDDFLYITNPGEYEFSNVLVKISPTLNIFVSEDNVKLFYVVDADKVEDDKNASISDIFIFDNLTNSKIKSEKILEIEKETQPKIIVVNGSHSEDTLESAEKVSKVKVKHSELDLIVDTKLYIL